MPLGPPADAPPRRKGRLLLVADQLVWPISSGNTLRTWNFIRALQRHYDISLIHPCRTLPDREALGHVEPCFEKIWSVADDGRRSPDTLRQNVTNKLRLVPWEMAQSYRPAFAAALARVVADGQFDIVLARYIYQARYLFERSGQIRSRIIVDVDDIETLKAHRLQQVASRESSRAGRMRIALNNWIFSQYHKRTLPLADLCIVCSDDDRHYLLKHRWASNVAVVPNAIDVSGFRTTPARGGKTLLFCGALSYEPNVDGIRWFVIDVLPHIRKLEPDVKVLIVGRHAARDIKALASEPGIALHEDVPDVAPFYERASVVIVPIRSGSGTRLKVIEAGACRRPVVSTTIGVEGLSMIPDRHCLIADDAAGFARKCADVLHDEEKAGRLAADHYEHVKSRYDSPRVHEGIRQLFGEVWRGTPA